ncbi:hypothetical protein BKA82DRAFT_4351985 [Pisolithus tinctorius]|nr:hypothetical protein BKA82DRAFT_4351985 [Pisolithus tinctorius]
MANVGPAPEPAVLWLWPMVVDFESVASIVGADDLVDAVEPEADINVDDI